MLPACGLLCGVVLVAGWMSGVNSEVTGGALPPALADCYRRYANVSLTRVVGKSIAWFCEAPRVRDANFLQDSQQDPQSQNYYTALYRKVLETRSRVKRQATPRCVRREYRMMTDQQRQDFHTALNMLKNDTSVPPNKYEAIANLHTGMAAFIAHGGPGFFGWHRAYLLIFEAALQEMVPGVCVPFWDSSLDSELEDPRTSYVWSSDFFGTAQGQVDRGPFAGWRGANGQPLVRNLGVEGELMTRVHLEGILAQEDIEDISAPSAMPEFDLELIHGGVHIYVGGSMEELDTAPHDPVFFLHHAYVDYVWELFRTKQRALGLNPEKYPTEAGSALHLGNATMGFGDITHAEGYYDNMTQTYRYEPSPECNSRDQDCGSRYLRCDLRLNRCLPVDPNAVVVTPPPPTRPTPTRPTNPGPGTGGSTGGSCPSNPLDTKPCQNSYCADGNCDIHQWVYVPVKVVSVRPPDFQQYGSFPVVGGYVQKASDIYSPNAYEKTSRYISQQRGHPKGYGNCDTATGSGQVFIHSRGLNYKGFYKESAIVDHRLAVSMAIAYVAVKDPGTGVSQALLRAYDSCGRICHTSCRIPGTANPARYTGCSGVVNIDSNLPKMWGRTYGEATTTVWGYENNRDCPSFNTDNFYMTFYCDYRDNIPWVDTPPVLQTQPHIRHTLNNIAAVASNSGTCRVSPQCTLNVPCGADQKKCDKYGDRQACRDTCSYYAVCVYGQYWERKCPWGMRYSAFDKACVPGQCVESGATSGGMMVPDWGNRGQIRASPGTNNYFQSIIGSRFGRFFG